MYARVWYEDGAISDRPMNVKWDDGNLAAEWPATGQSRVAVAWQAFHDDGTPIIARCEMRHEIGAGCTHACVLREIDLLGTELASAVTFPRC